uniref:HepT-like ribonuclease domain-containing protein n=1 Tax=Candidatus Electronema sp. TaxID=2698783 RepID=UPI00405710A7
MPHDPLVCVEDAVTACELILQFTLDMEEIEYAADLKTQSAVERQFEIIGEALNRIKGIDSGLLDRIDNWREIIGFRNVIAHGYDVIENEIVWGSVKEDVPVLLAQLKRMLNP